MSEFPTWWVRGREILQRLDAHLAPKDMPVAEWALTKISSKSEDEPDADIRPKMPPESVFGTAKALRDDLRMVMKDAGLDPDMDPYAMSEKIEAELRRREALLKTGDVAEGLRETVDAAVAKQVPDAGKGEPSASIEMSYKDIKPFRYGPLTYIMAAIIARMFPQKSDIDTLLEPGQVTVITDLAAEYQSEFMQVMLKSVFPEDIKIFDIIQDDKGDKRAILGLPEISRREGDIFVHWQKTNRSRVDSPSFSWESGRIPLITMIAERGDRLALEDDQKTLLRNYMERCTEAPIFLALPSASSLPHLPEKMGEGLKQLKIGKIDTAVLCMALHGYYGMDIGKLHGLIAPKFEDFGSFGVYGLMLAMRAKDVDGVLKILRETGKKPEKKITLDDIEGYGKAEEYARMMIDDLMAWSRKEIAWSDVTRSAIFYGETGTGKTFLARATANSGEGVSFYQGSFGKWHAAGRYGDMMEAMRKTFTDAKANRPAVVFLDELDSFQARGTGERNSYYNMTVVNALLELIDGSDMEGVVLIGACNHIDFIDEALLRPGRFDLKAEIMLPGRQAARQILSMNLPEGFDLDAVVEYAIGQSAAEIDAAIRKAKSEARRAKTEVTIAALQKALVPYPGQREKILKRVAAHEAGHAILGHHFHPGSVERLVLRQNGAGGAYMAGGPSEGVLEDLENRIAILMAGRAAEIMACGNASAGAGGSKDSDLARAMRLAIGIEARLGLGEYGIGYYDGRDHQWLENPEAMARAQARLAAGEVAARQILEEHQEQFDRLRGILAEKRFMEDDEIKAFFAA